MSNPFERRLLISARSNRDDLGLQQRKSRGDQPLRITYRRWRQRPSSYTLRRTKGSSHARHGHVNLPMEGNLRKIKSIVVDSEIEQVAEFKLCGRAELFPE